jgi:hypothetical protein
MKENITHQTQRRIIMEKGKRSMWKIGGLVMFVFAMVLTFASMAAAEDNFKVCVNGTNNDGDNIDYVLFAEPNDVRDGLFDVNGTGSISGIADLDFLVSGTADTSGGFINLSLDGQKIVENNQYSLFFSTTMYAVQDNTFGSFIAGLTVADLTNSNPETRYKLTGTAQVVPCE